MERQVAELAAHGNTNKEIASKFNISDETVKKHLSNIYKKLHIKSRVELRICFEDDSQLIKKRKKAIHGRWEGYAYQEFKDGKVKSKVKGELLIEHNTIHGETTYSYEINGEKITATFSLSGEFICESFLRLNYDNSDGYAKQFGSAVLELHPTERALDGQSIGFGPRFKEIVRSEIHLRKVASSDGT